MANSPLPLPERASLDYLRKLAKERLRAARVADPTATLAAHANTLRNLVLHRCTQSSGIRNWFVSCSITAPILTRATSATTRRRCTSRPPARRSRAFDCCWTPART